MKVYLAGGFRSGWQDVVIAKVVGPEYVDPRKHNLTDANEYTVADLYSLNKCDCVFAYLEKDNPSGYGMALEIGYAKAKNKLIIFCNESTNRYLSMVNCASSYTTTDFDSALEFMQNIFNLVGVS